MSFVLPVRTVDAVPEFAVVAADPGSSRLVYATVVGLVLVGAAFVVLAVWLIRQTRVDPDLLAPLERMGDGDWRRKDPATQRRLLDEVRPEGAEPLHTEPDPPGVDDEFEHAERSVRSLDDLQPLRPEGVHATPATGAPLPDASDPVGDTGDRQDDEVDAVADEDAAVAEEDAVVADEVDRVAEEGAVVADARVDDADAGAGDVVDDADADGGGADGDADRGTRAADAEHR